MSTGERRITSIEFIENHLLPDIGRMISQGFDYLAFPVIAQTIELIGSFFDSNPFDQSGVEAAKRADRFQNGIKHLFKDSAYKNNNGDFYENLRCSFAHQMRPGSGFYLTSLKNGVPRSNHLKKAGSGDRFLIIECFFDDLEKAVKRLLGDISKNLDKIDKAKVEQVFLVVKSVPIESGGSMTFGTVSAYDGRSFSTYHSGYEDPPREGTDSTK